MKIRKLLVDTMTITIGGSIVIPFSVLIYTAISPSEGFFRYFLELFSESWFWKTIVNTICVSSVSTILALILGTSAALIATRTDLRLSRIIEWSAIGSLFLSTIIHDVAWFILAEGRTGLLNIPFAESVIDIKSFWGICWVSAIHLSPYILIFVSSALKSMDPSLEEASKICGASTLRTFISVTMPIVAPALLYSSLFVVVLTLGTFTTPYILGAVVGYDTAPTIIYRLISLAPARTELATAYGSLVLLVGITITAFNYHFIKRKSFVTITGKGFRPFTIKIRKWRNLLSAYCLLYSILIFFLPLGITFFTSFQNYYGSLSLGLLNWTRFFLGYPVMPRAIWNSIIISIVGASLGVLASLFLAWNSIRLKTRTSLLSANLVLLSTAVPGLIMGLAMFRLWLWIPLLYGTLYSMIIALICRYIAYPVSLASSNLLQIHRELEESSRVCGAPTLFTVRKITFPLLKPGITAGWLLLFISILKDLTTILLLYNAKTIPLAALAFEAFQESHFGVYCAICIINTAILFLVAFIFVKVMGTDISVISRLP